MTREELIESMRKLFPQCDITENEITWVSGRKTHRWDAPYICGCRNSCITIDGDMTPSELQLLTEWVIS